jgi:transcriptional regulator with XRE-family HTH domain
VPESTLDEQEEKRVREQLEARRQDVLQRRREVAAAAGKLLREWRTGGRIEQKALAKMASVTDTVVRRVEKGDYGPTPESLIAAVLKLGGPARELQESARMMEQLKAEQAQLSKLLSRNVLYGYSEWKPVPRAPATSAGPIIVGSAPR